MPVCVTCFCLVRHRGNECRRCADSEPSYNCADVVDMYECIACDTAICIMHASEQQLQRQLCHSCFDAYRDDDFGYSDGEMEEMLGGEETEIFEFLDDNEFLQPPALPLASRMVQLCMTPTHVSPGVGNTHEKCSICLEDMHEQQVSTLPCSGNHLFHTLCIREWLQSGSADCPLCRTRVNVLLVPPITC